MIRTAIAFVGGFVLIIIESFIVMGIKGQNTIQFNTLMDFATIWVMNFFLLFTLFSHIKMWLDDKNSTKHQANNIH